MDQAGKQFSKSQRSGAEDMLGMDIRCPRHGAPSRAHSQRARDPGPDTLSPQKRSAGLPPVSPCWGPGRCRDRRAEVNGGAPSLPDADLRIRVSGQETAPGGGVAEGGQECPGPGVGQAAPQQWAELLHTHYWSDASTAEGEPDQLSVCVPTPRRHSA